MNILHIDSGILGDHSVSRRLTASIVARIKAERPSDTVTYRDLAAAPLAHLSGSHLMAASANPEGLDATLVSELDAGRASLNEFLAADVVVIGAPMYNFAIPSQLKTWIDRILVAGTTFRYTAEGVEGLAKGKKVIVASTRGGHYSGSSPISAMDHQETYLSTVFGFIGITDVEFVRAEGLAISPDSKEAAITEAEKAIAGRGHFDIAA
ncbi:FMN-dependent NADH-azoreductase [Rhizobium sp. LjRoot98]|uniref:FMN-dependent NADH-azoreductase n=1 Tax=unclassified Rhizobium TaxID=2613769 RepID=UPI0007150775|nr:MULTISPECIES: FMN-dependent NADH-azoreductase [unclassified Rhizobium]KQV40574.1 FMN-dependent NADH-azoreductase [Rhizobium sp. Root1204]KQX98623.1 FMN-dependent NADH-azoreductase [Rhizobium sp. Root1334]KRC10535.1 FMN-dependent NADH-azoreductase [Rhizobium sp. Root73]